MRTGEQLEWLGEWKEPFRDPIMILALRGPFDVANGATGAIRHLNKIYDSEEYARIEPNDFFDFTGERPIIRILEDGTRKLIWPETMCSAARLRGAENDLILVSGVEPHLKWKTFADCIFEIAEMAQVIKIVTLGSFAGLEPHTRSSGVAGSTSHAELTKELGLSEPTYQGPTGIVGVLNTWAQNSGTPVISLRVAVPDYATSAPSPEATRSLLARLEIITGIKTEYVSLELAAKKWREELDQALEENPELADYINHLEERIDESKDILPNGDNLSAQIEAYLRRDNGEM